MAASRGGVIASLAETLVAASPVAMIVVDAAGCVQVLNAAAEALVNRSAGQAVQTPLHDFLALPPASAADYASSAYDCLVTPSQGPPARVDLHVTPLPDAAGWSLLTLHPAGGVQSFVRRSDASRSAVAAAAMLAHEIKNPLAAIRGAAQLLAHRRPDDRELTELIRDEVDRVVRLIDGMEDFTDGRARQPAPENVHLLIARAVSLIRAAHPDGYDVEERFDPSLPPVLVVGDAIVQIFVNLLVNAIEARVDRAAKIIIETRFRHGLTFVGDGGRAPVPIEVAVIDDGPGPPPELVDHLFEPFVTGKANGRGLGLALVDKLVRDNGGMVQFAREGSPPRTVFRLLLQRA